MTMVDDPFGGVDVDEDPFATSEDVKGGVFAPKPKPEDLNGRLIAMIPRSFKADHPKPEQWRKDANDTVQDLYTVDLYVIDGGELRFWYDAKVEGSEDLVPTEQIIPAEDMPAAFEGVWILQQALIGQLKRVDGTARPILMGTMRRGPQAKEARAGKTFDDIRDAYDAWVARGKPDNKGPKFSWQVDVNVNADQRRQAQQWWATAKDSIKL